MISIDFIGGLGNHLFQIAVTYAMAIENNDKAVFNFNNCYTPLQGNKVGKYRNTIFKKFTHVDQFIAENHYQETSYSYTPIQYKPNLLLRGYFQSELYFKPYKDIILDMFCFDEYIESATNFLNKIPGKKTSIHVRRGDYIPYQHVMYLLDMEYYGPAMNMFEDNTFVIFSDDLDWVKQNFNKHNMIVFDDSDEVLNMACMSLCDNHIIANSTFSWWGAYLNRNVNKKVVAPKKWYSAPELIENISKIPNDWIVI